MAKQFIPARGRKLVGAGGGLVKTLRNNSSPQGDGNPLLFPATFRAIWKQFIPARGRKLWGKERQKRPQMKQFIPARGRKQPEPSVCVSIAETIHPRKGTETRVPARTSAPARKQFIPARGRKRELQAFEFDAARNNSSPQGDGNVGHSGTLVLFARNNSSPQGDGNTL